MIVNRRFVVNVRCCKWTLRLQTQIEQCRITKIADMKVVGVLWFYPEEVANIFSQCRIAAYSKWSIACDTDRYHKTGIDKDLCYDVKTNEGVVCNFY